MKIALIGNLRPDHSTENHVMQAFRSLGHVVHPVQEDDEAAWKVLGRDWDFILWTRTWPVPWSAEYVHGRITAPLVGFHLDRWWGLGREGQIDEQDFFKSDLLVTADGGHQEQWAGKGINHQWLPPGVSEFECVPGRPRREMMSDIAFVGSWQGYHPEWTHRPELIEFLRSTYGDRVRFWPEPGQPSVRGRALRDLYASTKVVVGDSCLVGNATHYWSDRIPETLGRGGCLVHPWVAGLEDHFAPVELTTWTIGEWDELESKIDHLLADDDARRAQAAAGRRRVLADHTYTVRAKQIIQFVMEEF